LEQVLPSGHTLVGDSTSPVTIVEFADLECPYCRKFQPVLDSVSLSNRGIVRLVYVALPLSMHRFAFPLARGAECAAMRGRLREWMSEVYSHSDSLGLKSWESYAVGAGIPDPSSIAICAMNPAPIPRIETGIASAATMGIQVTPTVLLNGWKYLHPPTRAELEKAVNALAHGEAPPGAKDSLAG
jgi:protein-disulfide isomerase